MKKKVALLLASVMTLSLLPVNVFAATNNYVDNRLTVPDKSAIVEHGTPGWGSTLAKSPDGKGDPEFYVDGTDLVIPLQRDVKKDFQFKLTLSGAKWYFRNNDPAVNATKDFTQESGHSTYDTRNGFYTPRGDSGAYGIYERTTSSALRLDSLYGYNQTFISGVPYLEALYTLEVSGLDNSVATVTMKDFYPGDINFNNWCIRIPLVTYISDSNVEATVQIESGNSSTVTSQKINFANTSDGKTKSTVKSVKTARDVFDLDTFIVKELRVGSIRNGEIIKLTLPNGYHFGDLNKVNVGIEKGLAWANGSNGYGDRLTGNFGDVKSDQIGGNKYFITYANSNRANDKLGDGRSYDSADDSEIWIYLGDVTSSTQLTGSIYIDGLQVWADDDASIPANGQNVEIYMGIKGKDNITEEKVLVAKRVDWTLNLSTTNTVPTLVSGRYIGPSWSGTDADDNTHKTARVKLAESANNAWWGSRTTVLALPASDNNVKGAKFRKVKVDDASEVNTKLKDTNTSSALYGTKSTNEWLNDGEKHGVITVNDNKITISNIDLSTEKASSINFDLWVSIEYGFGKQSSDLKLSIDPSSSSLTGTSKDNVPSVVIAHVVDPITVSTNVSDLKIGYQYQTTSDIQIKETQSKMLLKDKTVRVSITDLISSDMYFTPETKIQVTAGDLKIKNIIATGQGGFTSQSDSWLSPTKNQTGSLSFDIDKESTVASTVTISNVAVKLDRTVPVTNKSAYQAVIWGTAVAENYGMVDDKGRTWKADFNTVGEFLPYINVISSPDDQPSILSQEVRVTIGESYYVVNGKTYSMDAVSYISPASNSTMVPLRFVANAFGIRDDQILWDDANKTATINSPSKVLQFKIGSSSMLVNGISVAMQSPDGLPVSAEIKTINGLGRTYLPFRALGNAFGVSVDWEADTKTAIYNKGANANGAAAVSNNTASN